MRSHFYVWAILSSLWLPYEPMLSPICFRLWSMSYKVMSMGQDIKSESLRRCKKADMLVKPQRIKPLPSHSGCRCLLFCPALGAFVCCSVTSVAWSLWLWLTYISYGLSNTGPVTFLSDVWLAALTVVFLRNTPSWFAPFCAHLSNTLTC